MTNTLEYTLFSRLFNIIKLNDKEYYCNNLIDSVIITYIEEKKDLSNNFKEQIIDILKSGKYTKWRNIEIFIFYNNLFNILLQNNGKEYIELIKKSGKKECKIDDEKFKLIFNSIFGKNTGRKKFEVLKYWKEFSKNKPKIDNFIKILMKERLIKELSKEKLMDETQLNIVC